MHSPNAVHLRSVVEHLMNERCEEIEEEVIVTGLTTVSVQLHDRDCGVYYEAIIELSAVIFFAAS